MSVGYCPLTPFVPTPRLGLVVSVCSICVTLCVTTYALLTFHTQRVGINMVVLFTLIYGRAVNIYHLKFWGCTTSLRLDDIFRVNWPSKPRAACA
jgi:hypothetical protein